jgi:hypothetical protein
LFEEIDYANRIRSATILEFVEIYTTKFDSNGAYHKHKLRMAIGGHRSIEGKDFDRTYTPQLGSEEIPDIHPARVPVLFAHEECLCLRRVRPSGGVRIRDATAHHGPTGPAS